MLFACLGRARLPVMALVLVLVNALWLSAFTFIDAVVWATVAHSVQYLFVVSHAHAKDRARRSRTPSATPARGQMVAFYAISMAVGAGLFFGVPMLIHQASPLFGQPWTLAECYVMVVAAINLHHFIVDGYIWRSAPKRAPSTAPPTPATAH